MVKRQIVVMVIVLTLVLSGCTNTLNMYNLVGEIGRIDNIVIQGNLDINYNELPGGEGSRQLEGLDGFKLVYDVVQHKEDKEASVKLSVGLPDGGIIEVTHIIILDDYAYIHVKDIQENLDKIIKEYSIVMEEDYEEYEEDIAKLVDIDYIKVKLEERGYNLWEIDKAYQEETGKTLGVLEKVFEGLNTNMVTKEGNKFTLALSTENIVGIIFDTVEYVLDNTDKIYNSTIQIIEDMDDADYEIISDMLGIGGKEVMMDLLGIIKVMVERDKDGIKEALPEYKKELLDEINSFTGYNIEVNLEKEGKGSYNVGSRIKIRDTDLGYDLEIKQYSSIKEVDVKPGNMRVPEGKIVDLSEIERGSEITEAMIIDIDGGWYVYKHANGGVENGKIVVEMVNGSTYLPLRDVGEAFGEDVDWDNENRIPYILKYGDRIDMQGLLKDGKALVKIRDFEKLGYIVEWDGVKREVTIFK